ncbi:pentapeptide repeat-containing protein [Embleya sp. NPDC059259]|uniref:pentapeptide repeat-containing protein n=1 Tax=unclassified Embleya TaxID=2699296 RepID=UPI0036A74EAB
MHISGHTRCLAHLTAADQTAYLATLSPGADIDHRGTTFDGPLLTAILDALRDPTSAHPHFGKATFDQATFNTDVRFNGAIFSADATFNEAIFNGETLFEDATFSNARFNEVTFNADASFIDTTFNADVWFLSTVFGTEAFFDGVTFNADVWFAKATFNAKMWSMGALFKAQAYFGNTTFNAAALFHNTTFIADASFDNATFNDDAQFDYTKFDADARFTGARFLTTSQLGPLACWGSLDLSRAVFGVPVVLEAAAAKMRCIRTRWDATATLRLRHAVLDLTDAVVTQPIAVVTHPRPFTSSAGVALTTRSTTGPVHVVSLRGVDAAHLVLTDTDLTDCVFTGAFHLDQLRLTGRTVFAGTPTGIHWHHGVPRRWTKRRVLAEEHHWRATRTPPTNLAAPTAREWTPGRHHPDADLTPGPDDLAPVYRDLRKAFEDSKNEPGAADFYMGEMEMRRHDHHDTTPGERGLLIAYWALSGYGLRASRALAWLGLAMTATVLAMMLWGLPTSDPKPQVVGKQAAAGQDVRLTVDNPDPVLTGSLHTRLTSKRAEKATRVVLNSVAFRSSGQNLTTSGAYIEMTSRFLEPVLLGLAALAIRNRVKR